MASNRQEQTLRPAPLLPQLGPACAIQKGPLRPQSGLITCLPITTGPYPVLMRSIALLGLVASQANGNRGGPPPAMLRPTRLLSSLTTAQSRGLRRSILRVLHWSRTDGVSHTPGLPGGMLTTKVCRHSSGDRRMSSGRIQSVEPNLGENFQREAREVPSSAIAHLPKVVVPAIDWDRGGRLRLRGGMQSLDDCR